MTTTTLRRVGFFALAAMASTLTVKPVIGAEPSEELKAIRDVLQKIDQRMENSNNIALQTLDRMKADFGQLKSDMAQMRDDMARMSREVADLRNRGNSGASTSYFAGSAPVAPAATASIKLINTYISDMTAVINGTMYVVMPGQTRTVPLYAGNVSYQVLQTQDFSKTTTLQPGEVLTLSLYPRR